MKLSPKHAGLLALVFAAGVVTAVHAQAVLDKYDATLTVNKMSAATSGQKVFPLHSQRGVGMDGSARSGGVFPWSFAGNSLGGSPVSSVSRLGVIDLSTDAISLQEVDLALPATGAGRWTIGRSFNGRQNNGSQLDSNGPQGYNWFQSSQPELSVFVDGANHANDVVYLVYGADRYIEFRRTTSSSNVYKAKNGAAGVIEYKSGSPDTWEYTDQAGIVTTFFGGNTASGAADWQVWKVTDTAGNTAYVGDSTTASTAVTNGYNSDKTISFAYDAAGRRYSYSYTTVGVSRLTQVKAETKTGGTWASPTGLATAGQVDYTYYTTNEAGLGLIGDLKMVTLTTPLSTGADLVRKKHYRYYDQGYSNVDGRRGDIHQIKLIVGYEGCRNYDWAQDSTLDDDFLTATDADLKSYSDAWFEYENNAKRRITKAFFNGECGCSGGNNGTYTITAGESTNYGTYVGNGSYDNGFATRTVLQRPDSTWATYYFDETGQPLSTLITDTDPGSSPSQKWSTSVTRDSSTGVATRVSTPANNSAFTYSTGVATEIASGGGASLVTPIGVSATTNLVGLPSSSQWSTGTAGTAYLRSSRILGSVTKTIGSGTTVDIVRPTISESWVYTQDTTTEGNGTGPAGAYKTTMAYTFWGGGAELTPKVVTTTAPAASTSKNGSGSSAVATRYMRKDGTSAFALGPDGNYTYAQYTNGQLTRQTRDVKTNGTFTSGDDPNTDFGISETGSGDELTTTYAYDAQGRMTEMVPPDWQSASGTPTQVTYYAKLADGRQVTLSIPRRTVSGGTTTYMGPVGYTVSNQAGQTEFSATLVLSGGTTTTALSSWIDATKSDPIQAVTSGGLTSPSLFKITTSILSGDGRRVNATRSYFSNPSPTLPGTVGTNYDEQSFGYDDMGRRWRVKDATGTITRTVFDTLGRATETWIGTNDHSFSGGESAGSDNMTKTEVREYDGGSSGRNSLLTKVTKDPDGDWDNTGTGGHPADDRRITQYAYDARDRVVLTTNPQAPHSVVLYDSAGRVIASGGYSSASGLSATTDPTATTTNRISLSETAYDEAGRAYRTTQHKINLSTGASDDTLLTDTWRDEVGRTLKTRGTSISKTFYDRQSRPYRQFTIAKLNDNAGTGSEPDTDIAQAGTVTGDLVLEERQTVYDTLSGQVLFTVALQRLHSDTTIGALDGNADADIATLTVANGGSNVDYNKVRVSSVSATWYDDLHRPTAVANYGTNSSSAGAAGNGATFTRPGSAPSTSSTVLVSTTAYNDNGTVLSTTDPRGIVTRMTCDAMGRTTKVQRNYVDGTPGGGTNADEDQTIEYGFTNGMQTTYVARVPGGSDQTTTYIFGSTKGTSAGQSAIATGYLLRATKFPDSTNAGTTLANIDSDSSDVVSVAYNSLGQEIYKKDQVGSVVQTDYDTAGRATYRRATTTGGSVNTDVLRIGTTYTNRGQVDAITQYNNAAVGAGSVVDEVKYLYDDWGNVTNFQQDRDSAVSSSGGTNGYQEVAYSFTKATPTYGAVAVRPTTVTLPGSFAVTLDYGTANGLNDCVSRVDRVKFSSTSIAAYEYLGMGTLISTELKEVAAASRLYNSSTPASYEGLDQFGRTVISRWQKTGVGGREFYHVGLAYDYDSNIVSASDTVNTGYDAKYTMDGLNRLIVADEGTLSGGSITSRTRKETWGLNQVGDWSTFTSDLNGDGTLSSPAFGPTDEKNETRTFNTVNEILTRVNNGVTKSPAYNANGQQTDDGVNYLYEWDAWGRLTKVTTRGGSPATVVQYKYNGLNYVIGRHADLDNSGTVDNTDKWEWFVYDPRWRHVATFMVAGGSTFTGSADTSPKEQYVHHAAGRFGNGSYIDSVILRNRDQTNGNNGAADGTLENREYYCQNWRADVSVTMTDTGRILEWLKYSAYGVAQRIAAADFNRDSFVDFFDDGDFATAYGLGSASADINFDGSTNATDNSQWTTSYAEQGGTSRGALSQATGAPAGNRIGYAGYWCEPSTQQYLVRYRGVDPLIGVWDERDPAGYLDGSQLYLYGSAGPVVSVDPLGLECEPVLLPPPSGTWPTVWTSAWATAGAWYLNPVSPGSVIAGFTHLEVYGDTFATSSYAEGRTSAAFWALATGMLTNLSATDPLNARWYWRIAKPILGVQSPRLPYTVYCDDDGVPQTIRMRPLGALTGVNPRKDADGYILDQIDVSIDATKLPLRSGFPARHAPLGSFWSGWIAGLQFEHFGSYTAFASISTVLGTNYQKCNVNWGSPNSVAPMGGSSRPYEWTCLCRRGMLPDRLEVSPEYAVRTTHGRVRDGSGGGGN